MSDMVQLGSRVFGTQANGDRHIVETVEGWWGGPEVRQSTLSPSGEHGDVITESYYRGRRITLKGKSEPGPGRTGFDAAQFLEDGSDLIAGAAYLRVNEPVSAGGPKRAKVRKAGRSRMDVRVNRAEWEIPLIAPDPRKYSLTLQEETVEIEAGGIDTTSDMTVLNTGNAPTYPESIRVWGTGHAPIRLMRVDTGHEIVLEQNPIADDEYLLLPQEREVYYGPPGDQERAYNLVGAATRWWMIREDGATTQIRLRRPNAATGALKATVKFRSAWW